VLGVSNTARSGAKKFFGSFFQKRTSCLRPEEKERPMRVAVILFGVARAVPVTIKSIKKHVYACNAEAEFSFYTIASLNMVERISNPRTGEKGVSVKPADALLLNADAYTLVRQNDEDIAEALAAAKLQPDLFNNDWISVRNTLHQLASLRRAWALSLNLSRGNFDYFLFLRPDLLYLDDIRLKDVVRRFRGSGNIALPAWHGWGGFNDRFAFADAEAARDYAERLTLVPEYCAKAAFHPERFLSYALEKAQRSVCELPVRARRARAHGAILREDFSASRIKIPANPGKFSIQSGQVLFYEAKTMSELNNEIPPEAEVTGSQPLRLCRRTVDGHSRVTPLAGIPYLEFLKALHKKRNVQRYLEVGTHGGHSLSLARKAALAIDPEFLLDKKRWSKKRDVHLFEMTSDDFFAAHDPVAILGQPIDLAFIDGMHWSEFVLRDFCNVERHCSPESLIVLHDAVPINFEMTERVRRQEARRDEAFSWYWTGDVWRVVPLLRRERPDLRIQVLDCPPTGLVLVSQLNPQYRMPAGRLEALTRELAESEVQEPEFWSFIESLSVMESRTWFSGAKPRGRWGLSSILRPFFSQRR